MNSKTRNRIPKEFFITSGAGDSDNQIHAGSYHIALHEAGICEYNIMSYSSVLPAISKEIKQQDAEKMPFGSELMTIMSSVNGRRGDTISAGIILGWLYDGENKIGGLVCEVSGRFDENTLLIRLNASIHELHERTFATMKLKDLKIVARTHTVKRKYGTALCALCFTSFE